MLPSAGDDDGISRLVSGAQGETKHTNTGGEALESFSRGQDKKKRPYTKVSLSQHAARDDLHPP